MLGRMPATVACFTTLTHGTPWPHEIGLGPRVKGPESIHCLGTYVSSVILLIHLHVYDVVWVDGAEDLDQPAGLVFSREPWTKRLAITEA